MKVYDAELVNGILKQASDAMHGIANWAAGVRTENSQLQEKVASLQRELVIAKEAAADKVDLEKVASPSHTVDTTKAGEFVNMLVNHGIVPQDRREDFINKCAADSSMAIDVAMKALTLSEAPAGQGHGIKAASDVSGDPRAAVNAVWEAAFSEKW